MPDTPYVLAILPARGGSKGLPRKNVRPIAGKPLIAYSVEAAKASPLVNRVARESMHRTLEALRRHFQA